MVREPNLRAENIAPRITANTPTKPNEAEEQLPKKLQTLPKEDENTVPGAMKPQSAYKRGRKVNVLPGQPEDISLRPIVKPSTEVNEEEEQQLQGELPKLFKQGKNTAPRASKPALPAELPKASLKVLQKALGLLPIPRIQMWM